MIVGENFKKRLRTGKEEEGMAEMEVTVDKREKG